MCMYMWMEFFFKDSQEMWWLLLGEVRTVQHFVLFDFIYHAYLLFHKENLKKKKAADFVWNFLEAELSNHTLIPPQEKKDNKRKGRKHRSHFKMCPKSVWFSPDRGKKITKWIKI